MVTRCGKVEIVSSTLGRSNIELKLEIACDNVDKGIDLLFLL